MDRDEIQSLSWRQMLGGVDVVSCPLGFLSRSYIRCKKQGKDLEKEIKLRTLDDTIRSLFNVIDLLLEILDSKIYTSCIFIPTTFVRQSFWNFYFYGSPFSLPLDLGFQRFLGTPQTSPPPKKKYIRNSLEKNHWAQDFLSGDTSPGSLVRSWHPLHGETLVVLVELLEWWNTWPFFPGFTEVCLKPKTSLANWIWTTRDMCRSPCVLDDWMSILGAGWCWIWVESRNWAEISVTLWRFISRLIDNLKYKTLETLLFENQQGRPVFMFHLAMMRWV